VVPPSKSWKTARDVVEAAKAAPGKLSYGSAGTGSGTHMNGEKFRLRAGFEAVHVPYKGPSEGLQDIMGDRIDFMFAPIVSAISLIKDGRVVVIAVGSARRSSVLPDIPTTEESGYPDSAYRFWVGMLTPSGTPSAVVERLNKAVREVLATAEIKERLAALGADAAPTTPADFDKLIARELVDNAALAKEAGINPQ
jgi:tripartite-type tricarboxylate transporter receptor subunit TctC